MANFRVHITVSSVSSGVLASCLLQPGPLTPLGVVACTALGAMGGMLPDVDSDHSTPAQLLFTVVSAILAFLAMFSLVERFSIVELVALWAAVYLALKRGAFVWIERLTAHRGMFHSIPAALGAGLLVTLLAGNLLPIAPLQAWLGGFFLFFGYMAHLVLDEVYSVDLHDRHIKRSLGTALKLFSFRQPKESALVWIAVAVLYLLTPSLHDFRALITDPRLYQSMLHKLLPHGKLFGLG